jgi:hypothetical protein
VPASRRAPDSLRRAGSSARGRARTLAPSATRLHTVRQPLGPAPLNCRSGWPTLRNNRSGRPTDKGSFGSARIFGSPP